MRSRDWRRARKLHSFGPTHAWVLRTTTEALRTSEERLQLALQAGGSGAWDWDFSRDAAEVSPSYRELFGLAPDLTVTYEVWLSHVHPEDRQRCREYGEAFFAGRETDWRLQFRIVRGDGKVRWHRAIGKVYRDAAGKPLRFVGVSTDVTEEQRALAALSESEARFRAMADGLPLIVWMHDAEGAQQFVNRTFLEYFDVEEEEMKGGRWQLLMHPEDGPIYAEEFMACVSERKPFHAEVRVRNGRANGATSKVVGAAALVRGGRVPRHGGHERRCHRAPAHGAGAARCRPAQGRVSGDARPRAAQSPGGHIPGAGQLPPRAAGGVAARPHA